MTEFVSAKTRQAIETLYRLGELPETIREMLFLRHVETVVDVIRAMEPVTEPCPANGVTLPLRKSFLDAVTPKARARRVTARALMMRVLAVLERSPDLIDAILHDGAST
ncbi:hypothetical protein [Thalassococcus sp. S3]|uniref:hypothetical protein n=1 Tax=Thalassococcus sp. S3 TaxID=2017482 RepID=UPI00102424BB|nr:hypothetical protein [Thalassococcus sp. S3]QBF31532.1 hypothetical protein CFI11_09930 [Thalassococcus sp. S3]